MEGGGSTHGGGLGRVVICGDCCLFLVDEVFECECCDLVNMIYVYLCLILLLDSIAAEMYILHFADYCRLTL